MKRVFPWLVTLVAIPLVVGCGQRSGQSSSSQSAGDRALQRVLDAGVLVWGADVIGGVPYVYEDPKNPGTYIGFEMDIAKAIARELGVEQRLVIKAWDTLIPELQRGSFDMAMNGIEDTEQREKIVVFSDPYFVYSQQITVRRETDGIDELSDLVGKTVATLSGTAAEDILRATEGVHVQTNPEIIYSYGDLESGKVDAVLLDTPIAAAYGASNPHLKNVGASFEEGRYVIAFRAGEESLVRAVNDALERIKDSGELKRIYEKFGIMDEHQEGIGIL